jgi:uncharacterized protein (DUF2236 family)
MLAGELVRIPREVIPPTVPELRAYMRGVIDSGILQATESALRVAELFDHPPNDAEWRPVLRGVSRLAFATLPPELREMYGISLGPAKGAAVAATFFATRVLRPLLPSRYRYIAPYQEARRAQGRDAQAPATRGSSATAE